MAPAVLYRTRPGHTLGYRPPRIRSSTTCRESLCSPAEFPAARSSIALIAGDDSATTRGAWYIRLVAEGRWTVQCRSRFSADFLDGTPIAPPESPAIPLFPAYLRSFAGVSHRRDLCPTSTNPRLDSSTASPT